MYQYDSGSSLYSKMHGGVINRMGLCNKLLLQVFRIEVVRKCSLIYYLLFIYTFHNLCER